MQAYDVGQPFVLSRQDQSFVSRCIASLAANNGMPQILIRSSCRCLDKRNGDLTYAAKTANTYLIDQCVIEANVSTIFKCLRHRQSIELDHMTADDGQLYFLFF